jgi:NAD(P)-dependent dehydrogenase (short-subunit alcohol dehydrogenase family)
MSKSVILVTGASSGFGLMTAQSLAQAGHTVYASMRETAGRNAPQVAAIASWAADKKVDLRSVELDVRSDASADASIAHIIAHAGRLDVIVHNAGHMVFGPAEAFTPEQLSQQYDVNVLGTQRVNRAALPHLRRQRKGLMVWVGSSSTRGRTPPFLAPYFAAKAAMDALAVSYSTELALWGIETMIMVQGAVDRGGRAAKQCRSLGGGPAEHIAYTAWRAGVAAAPEWRRQERAAQPRMEPERYRLVHSRSGCRSFKPSILRRGCGPPTARRVLQGPAAAQGGDAADQVGAGQFRIRRPRVACWWRGRPNQERSSKNCAPAGTASAEPATTIASMIANRCKIRVLLGLVINLRRGEFFA